MALSNMNLIRALVSQLRETQALACGGGGGGCGGCGGGGVQTKTIISPKLNFKFRGYNNCLVYRYVSLQNNASSNTNK